MPHGEDSGAGIDFSTARGRDWPSVRQFNVFIANRVGALMHVVRQFETTDIHIVALTVVDSADCAIIRMVLSNPERALEIFERAKLPVTESDLLVVQLPDGSWGRPVGGHPALERRVAGPQRRSDPGAALGVVAAGERPVGEPRSVGRPAGGDRAQGPGVVEQVGQGDQRPHDLVGLARLDADDLAAPVGQVAHHVAEPVLGRGDLEAHHRDPPLRHAVFL